MQTMYERYGVSVDGGETEICDLRGLVQAGNYIRTADGTLAIVERVIHPVGRRIVLECSTPKPAAKPARKKAPRPAAESSED